jgi:sterol desaturase/sphingolipid hydroxylase (fatty acid hydroxylase superfamily)
MGITPHCAQQSLLYPKDDAQRVFCRVWRCHGVAVENDFAYSWATGRLSFFTTEDVVHSPLAAIVVVATAAFMPLWRAAHFFAGHRFLHFGPLYTHVHSLHHRNTDIECFAGVTMHPVEHLFYFTAVMPALFFAVHPTVLVWTGFAMMLSPAASHSGYEDTMQSDSHHYMHHRYFDVNFASYDAAAVDVFFGTFMASFAEREPKAEADGGALERNSSLGHATAHL